MRLGTRAKLFKAKLLGEREAIELTADVPDTFVASDLARRVLRDFGGLSLTTKDGEHLDLRPGRCEESYPLIQKLSKSSGTPYFPVGFLDDQVGCCLLVAPNGNTVLLVDNLIDPPQLLPIGDTFEDALDSLL